jgi:uncharacterized protein (TIGR00303 family)
MQFADGGRGGGAMRFVLVGGATRTAAIEGISAAGAEPELMAHTPSADAEILEYGTTVRSPVVPVSPTGCPTPAVVSRAVREAMGFPVTTIDAGMAEPTGAPVVEIGADPGGDIRNAVPVPEAGDLLSGARRFGASLPEEHLYIGETIPGGTTTALGTLAALGERPSVSSSLPENPTGLKTDVVDTGLSASGIAPGSAAGDPVAAVRTMGDPVLPVVAGLALGAIEAGTEVTLAGGTQLLAAAALIRHAGIDRPLTVATTTFVVEDGSAEVAELAADLGVNLRVTNPGFDGTEHPAMAAFARGEAKEGVGMGGLLAAAEDAGVQQEQIHERVRAVYERFHSES